ncbi:MAG TPA: nitrous oxide reductase family maturation protein NosD [Thermodesulfobacteriota bacterium]|nr:nitrous oxide reductase family maturation protein NosD [Thermodesulfobacteriota bacterium]
MKTYLIAICILVVTSAGGSFAYGKTLTVSPEGPLKSVSGAIASAEAGDTIRVLSGEYRENIVIDKALTVIGEDYPLIDGGGKGVVVWIKAQGTVFKGMRVTGSGMSLNLEDTGILVDTARGSVIEDNRLGDVLFGIYVKNSPDCVIRGNAVEGKGLPLAERGDGIKLWYSSGTKIIKNHLYNTRDLVMWWSGDTVIEGNRVEKGRYGLHYMYSNNNVFKDNIFIDNYVGGFLMYSDGITFRNNIFARNQGPATGYGIGFKDLDHVRAEGNLFIDNRIGMYMDNSPHLIDAWNRIDDNVIAYNDIGVSMMPSIERNIFVSNTFLENHEQVEVRGGGHLAGNLWFKDGSGNYWSDYVGYDEDGDGMGEIPYRSEKLFESIIDEIPELRLFIYSPVSKAIELAAEAFPVIKPEPKLIDEHPLIGSRVPDRFLSGKSEVSLKLLLVSFGMVLAPLIFYGCILKR